MVAERARRGMNVPTTSASFNKLHNEDPYDEQTNKNVNQLHNLNLNE